MVVGVGTDLIEIARIAQSIERYGERFLERVFTQREIDYCQRKQKNSAESFAARFAAKEAGAKALGTGISQGVGWLDLEVTRQPGARPMLALSVLVGFAGVALLLMPGGKQHLALVPCLAILCGATTWSLGSVLTRSMELPKSRPTTAGAAMMLGGAMLLLLSAGFGEMHPFPHISIRSAEAELYLIVFGSLVAFTAYVWLLGHFPATRVSSHAYVNPIVAVFTGWLVLDEHLDVLQLTGAAIVFAGVALVQNVRLWPRRRPPVSLPSA